jgi:hypothetical protein
MKESEKIADTIRAFSKECAAISDDPSTQQWKECREKRVAIAEALAQFVILANEELDFLPENPHSKDSEPKNNPSFDAWKKLHPDYNPAHEDKRTLARRKDMQLHIRWAQHYINCLGRENASECKAEKAALDKETYPFGKLGLMNIGASNPRRRRRGKALASNGDRCWHRADRSGVAGRCATERRSSRLPSALRAEFRSAARLRRTLAENKTGLRRLLPDTARTQAVERAC